MHENNGQTVRQDLVPENKLIEGDSIAICCAHGDTVVYPLEVEVNGQTHEVEAAVSSTLYADGYRYASTAEAGDKYVR